MALTRADEYPIHQLPEPIAQAAGERNFYDRFFFNGYTRDGTHYFAVALGVYPQLNVMDAAFCVLADGVQHNLRASRVLDLERCDTRVGPIAIDIVEPLRVLGITVDDPEHDLRAKLTFTGRSPALEEPRFTRRLGGRIVMDYTRMTQFGHWEGSIDLGAERIDVRPDAFLGIRDRSWGIRPVGAPDSQAVAPPSEPQFFWLWAPLDFGDHASHYFDNADGDGTSWNTRGTIVRLEDGTIEAYPEVDAELRLRSGSRHASGCTLTYYQRGSAAATVELDCRSGFYMSGLGYMHPQWGHGMYRGELDVAYDTYELAKADPNSLLHLHVQAFCRARLTTRDGIEREGCGVLEQLILGRFEPLGLKSLLGPT